MLRIAVPQSGQVKELCRELLEQVGVLPHVITQQVVALRDIPAILYFMPAEQIPQALKLEQVNVAFCDMIDIQERELSEGQVVKRLGLNKQNLTIFMPESIRYKGLDSISGRSIVTPYPNLLSKFVSESSISVDIKCINNIAEDVFDFGRKQLVCDVSSNAPLYQRNKMKPICVVSTSELVIFASYHITEHAKMMLDDLLLRVESCQKAQQLRSVRFMAPKQVALRIKNLLNVIQAMCVRIDELESSLLVSGVMYEKRIWDAIDRLKELGARDIAISKIDKFIV